MKHVDAIVVGAGVMGSAAARALALAGREVVLFERFAVGHAHGSSHGSARIWRHSYTDARYVRMMQRALPLWRDLEDEAGEQLLSVTGALNFGVGLDDLEHAMGEGGAAAERLSADEVRARFPLIAPPGPSLYEPLAGVIAADSAWRALLASALSNGVTLVDGVRAGLEVGAGEISVGEWRAPVAIVTAGAWVQDHVPWLDVHVTRETVSYYDADVAGIPATIEWGAPAMYAVPTPDGTLKVASHIAGPTVDPDEEGAPDELSLARDDAWLAERLPSVRASRVAAETCLYTSTPDHHFVIERHDNVVVGSACSGHGFKFAPLVGARLAELALSE